MNNASCPKTGADPACEQVLATPRYAGSPITMDTRSYGGGYSPFYHEYWYPLWSGTTVYRYDAQHRLLGSFDSGQSQMMQIWGDDDGTYYSANWGLGTITKRAGPGGAQLWSTSLGTTAGGVAADADYVYAMASGDLRLWQLDKTDGHVVRTSTLVGGSTATLYGGLAVVQGKLFVGRNDGLVYQYDLATNQLDTQFPVAVPIDNSSFDGRDYCVSQNDANLDRYTLQLASCPHGDDCADGDPAHSPGRPRRATGSTRTATA